MIVQDSLEDEKGHGYDGADLPFKRTALVVCGSWGKDDKTWVGLLEYLQYFEVFPPQMSIENKCLSK